MSARRGSYLTGMLEARILIVDDHEPNARLMEQQLRRLGHREIRRYSDPTLVLPAYEEWRPDLIVLDLHMPRLDGFAVLELLKAAVPHSEYLPVLVLTADITPEARDRALALGAKDFLRKPADPTELALRIKNLLETRMLHLEVQQHSEELEGRVRERTLELERATRDTLHRLAIATDFRDDATGEHSRRVGRMAALVAQAIGLPGELVELYECAAPLHDVGKIAVPDRILLKRGKLTAKEFEIMKRHVEFGSELLSGSESPCLRLAEEIARTHHERWDGTGYLGLRGGEIPLSGRIVSVVDVFDALTSERTYKRAWPERESVDEIARVRGAWFDPEVVDVFLGLSENGQLRAA